MYLGVFFLCIHLAELGLDLKTQCMCVLYFLSHSSGFSRTVISLHALRFLGWLGNGEPLPPTLSFVNFECVMSFFSRHTPFSTFLPGIWQLVSLVHGPN